MKKCMKHLSWVYILCTLVSFFSACSSCNDGIPDDVRGEMRAFVIALSEYARGIDPDFIVIPQNGHELVTLNGEPDGPVAQEYLGAISGGGQEDLDYGYDGDGIPTPAVSKDRMNGFLGVIEHNGKQALVIDYCTSNTQIDDSYSVNDARGYITFATTDRELSMIPSYPASPYNGDHSNIATLAEAKNFLYLLNAESFSDKAAYLGALEGTSHDLLIIDLFDNDGEALAPADVAALKVKSGGGTRLVVAYMSIGEAEDYRYYWQPSWTPGDPRWLDNENEDWEGNYKVHFWDPEWQAVIYGNDDSYLKMIIDAGFDGVYLDLIDAYEYYE